MTYEQKQARKQKDKEYRQRKKNPLTDEQKQQLLIQKAEARKQKLREYSKRYREKNPKPSLEERRIKRLEAKKAMKEQKKIEQKLRNNAKRKPTLAQLGIEPKPRKSLTPKPVRIPKKHKHIMRPMQKIREQGKVLPTINHDLSTKVKLHIPELRLDVFINPGQDIEAVRQKYLKR